MRDFKKKKDWTHDCQAEINFHVPLSSHVFLPLLNTKMSNEMMEKESLCRGIDNLDALFSLLSIHHRKVGP